MSKLFGRNKIYTSIEEITADNVLQVLNDALPYHCQNIAEEDYLYWYRRGRQPINNRTKEIRPEINNKIVENIADQIVTFKNGYFLTRPAFYVARTSDENTFNQVNQLNEFLNASGKPEVDNEVVDWFHTVGVAPIYVRASLDPMSPVKVYSLAPQQAFVVYSRRPGNAPVMGVIINIVNYDEKARLNRVKFDVYTKFQIFHIDGTMTCPDVSNELLPVTSTALSIESYEDKAIEGIEIIEYEYNRNRMSAFESVLDLLDAVNQVQSDRENGIEQFIQSLLILKNCTLDEDDDGNKISARDIREKGLIELKSTSDNPADVTIIADQLDQSQTQVYVEDLLHRICDIAGMPFTSNAGTSDSSNNGAVFLRNGWSSADCFARNTEDLFRKSNKLFDKIFLRIVQYNSNITISRYDIDIQFTRGEMENLLIKTQGALNLKQLGFSPELVLGKSGLSNDPAGDYARSKDYMDVAFTNGQNVQPQPVNEGVENGENNETGSVERTGNT